MGWMVTRYYVVLNGMTIFENDKMEQLFVILMQIFPLPQVIFGCWKLSISRSISAYISIGIDKFYLEHFFFFEKSTGIIFV